MSYWKHFSMNMAAAWLSLFEFNNFGAAVMHLIHALIPTAATIRHNNKEQTWTKK